MTAGVPRAADGCARPSRPLGLFGPADRRARELLGSLLRPSEQEQWERTGSFWVHTEPGWFRFGTLYDIRFRSARWPWVERSICVVTEGFEQRPLADLWCELVVTARADPTRLTGVANFRAEAPARLPGSSDPLVLRRAVDQIRAQHRALVDRGYELDAAYLAFDTAKRLSRTCRPRWAAPFEAAAVSRIRRLAARHPAERERLEEAHAAILAGPEAA
jgi:hypothetical protein